MPTVLNYQNGLGPRLDKNHQEAIAKHQQIMSRYQFTSGSNPSTGGSKARSGQSLMRVPGEQPPALNECSSYNVLDEDEVFEDEMSEDESEF